MIEKIDANEARAFSTLRVDGNWLTVRRLIERSLAHIDQRLRTTHGDELIQMQGAAQALASLLNKADEAPEILERYKTRA